MIKPLGLFSILLLAVWGWSGDQEDAAASGRMLRKEVTVRASLDAVWHAWTTPEGIASFFAPESKIELKPGGAYELYIDNRPETPEGSRGCEGCTVLSLVPRAMLSFTWNAPPTFPNLRFERTTVALLFQESGPEEIRVQLTHLGWGEGFEWDQAYDYFDRAWDWVLNNLKKKVGNEDAANPEAETEEDAGPEAEAVLRGQGDLGPFARLVGRWRVDGKWVNGDELHAITEYRWGVNQKLLHSQTLILEGETPEPQYETVIAWHPHKKTYFFTSFSAQGAVFEGVIEARGDELRFQWKRYSAGGVTDFSQTIRFLDDDRHAWTAHVMQDGEKQVVIDAVYHRQK